MSPIEKDYRGIDGYIFLTACKYYRAANYIPKSDRGAPYYVNLAFAIELFIKCLDVSTKTIFESELPFQMIEHEQTIHARIRGHSLKGMYESLPEQMKEHIAECYLEATNNNILDDLEEIKNVFVEWRYHFEQQSISVSVGILERIAEFFKGYIDSVLSH
ncbi:hypothetical protein [Marinobacterium sediminicola]|uniref:HEPN domain-containing protein n=1 Tax=Marinobacterium sediminicola TaxID=518898 RepID=A0ABY1S017_9GAMM|nr:hypothetical protein [Marinobacterium sediminicola]ULG68969.1 hypothetical protein LN244_14970 [Marinobacterium sediminicola]SMR73847.1 hypothetical protein SAMN04487964_105226 [Marinobacterium sediminicola]